MHLDLCRLDGAGAAEAGVALSADGRRLSEAGAGGSAAAAVWFVQRRGLASMRPGS